VRLAKSRRTHGALSVNPRSILMASMILSVYYLLKGISR